MNSLIAAETSLLNQKEQLLNELEELTQEIEDLLTDDSTDTTTNCKILRIKRNEVQTQYMQIICDLARIEVRKEIVCTLVEKGLTEEAAAIFMEKGPRTT
jgi:ElaB/YqjD/DUF883 family membrane-anchored ribosome-binding protein